MTTTGNPSIDIGQSVVVYLEENQTLEFKKGQADVEKPEPIVNPYCTELAAALALGRVQIDLGSNPSPVTQKVVFTGEASVGWVCESYDRLNGAAWRGMITGVQHGMDSSGKLITQINMLRGE